MHLDLSNNLISRARSLSDEEKEFFYQVNKYVRLAHEDYRPWVVEVDECPPFKGLWREKMGLQPDDPLDLEIGTGNGYYFEYRCRTFQQRGLVGIELKYKPLIQTVKRALLTGHKHFKVVRYDASYIQSMFTENELNDVFIFFPDPWEKRRENKHRLINSEFLMALHRIQRPGTRLTIKTDSESYYNWICEVLKSSPYKVVATETDLHNSKWAEGNFQTHFERLWTRKGRKTFYVQLDR